MEMNTCAVNYLDADSLLPPRKRLLASLKRQSSDVNPPVPSNPSSNGSLPIKCDNQLNNLLKAQLSNPNLSNEEIANTSKSAAIEAVKIATAARAIAEEKASKAAKAVANAKTALDLIAIISEENAENEKSLKRNKMKKEVPVEALYNKRKGSGRTDEEVARNLHRVMNSSPRITKNSTGGKRLKRSTTIEKSDVPNGVSLTEETEPSLTPSNGILVNPDEHDLTSDTCQVDGEGLTQPPSTDKVVELSDIFGKKKGKLKQKKLPLSICSFKDQSSRPKEDLGSIGGPQSEGEVGETEESLFPVEKATLWKCQEFKAPTCVKQSKVMQS